MTTIQAYILVRQSKTWENAEDTLTKLYTNNKITKEQMYKIATAINEEYDDLNN